MTICIHIRISVGKLTNYKAGSKMASDKSLCDSLQHLRLAGRNSWPTRKPH